MRKQRLKEEKDPASERRLEILQRELADYKEEANQMKSKWESEKNEISKIREVREQIDHLRHELEEAENNYDLNKAANYATVESRLWKKNCLS